MPEPLDIPSLVYSKAKEAMPKMIMDAAATSPRDTRSRSVLRGVRPSLFRLGMAKFDVNAPMARPGSNPRLDRSLSDIAPSDPTL
jgi:hypothetical protein